MRKHPILKPLFPLPPATLLSEGCQPSGSGRGPWHRLTSWGSVQEMFILDFKISVLKKHYNRKTCSLLKEAKSRKYVTVARPFPPPGPCPTCPGPSAPTPAVLPGTRWARMGDCILDTVGGPCLFSPNMSRAFFWTVFSVLYIGAG